MKIYQLKRGDRFRLINNPSYIGEFIKMDGAYAHVKPNTGFAEIDYLFCGTDVDKIEVKDDSLSEV